MRRQSGETGGCGTGRPISRATASTSAFAAPIVSASRSASTTGQFRHTKALSASGNGAYVTAGCFPSAPGRGVLHAAHGNAGTIAAAASANIICFMSFS